MTEKLVISGEIPQSRFGHTITQISKNMVILFGGATGDTGRYSITGDVFACELNLRRWKRLTPKGNGPTNRAAHCAVSIDNNNKLIIFGGAVGGGGLADDNLYVLDFNNGEDQTYWLTIPIVGSTPGRRYGHSMVFIKPFLVVFGGNTGNEPVNDSWSLNLEKSPYCWQKLECSGDIPQVRVYHSAALCTSGAANGMMVIFGGRTSDSFAQSDTWGLRRHRDGRWDWVKAPYKNNTELPISRYQHSTVFQGPLMFVIGGRSNQMNDQIFLEIYDTETSDWHKFPGINRFRHSVWIMENFLYVHGGFDTESPNIPTDSILRLDLVRLLSPFPNLMRQMQKQEATRPQQNRRPESNNVMAIEENRPSQNQPIIKAPYNPKPQNPYLASDVVVAVKSDPNQESQPLKKYPLNSLVKENIKINQHQRFQNDGTMKKQYIQSIIQPFIDSLLQPEYENSMQRDMLSQIRRENIIKLCDEVQRVFERESMVLKVRAPLKIFGSINGQYDDLMRFFNHFGAPCDSDLMDRDIDSNDYLFLGNYVGRGSAQLEVILLLFSLKLKYQDQFHMIRGNMEDKRINKAMGFADECYQKFSEDINEPNSIFQRINKVFEYMPIAAVIQDSFLALHGGIGTTLRAIDEIEHIPRPLEIIQDPKTYQHKVALELLWSDPVINENQQENTDNVEHDIFQLKNVTRFGSQRISKFMQENNISLIIRSHEPVYSGIQIQNNNVITLFSNTNYCNKYQNQGAILSIMKQLQMQPKVIQPIINVNNKSQWIDLEAMMEIRKQTNKNNIMVDQEEIHLRKRQPTPPRDKDSYKS
ncbi:hypothetical protein ABPG74_012735 [Tetrahymena malaccensis]